MRACYWEFEPWGGGGSVTLGRRSMLGQEGVVFALRTGTSQIAVDAEQRGRCRVLEYGGEGRA